MFGVNSSQVKKAFLLTLCWLLFLAFFSEKPFWSLRHDLHDHISNLHSSVLFWHKGFDIYKQPANMLLQADQSENALRLADYWKWPKEEFFHLPERSNNNPLMIVWGHMPRPYPPGLYLLLSPLALVMESLGGFSENTLILLVFTFCFCAHLVFFQIRNLLIKIETPYKLKWLLNLILVAIYFEIIGWSISGQYEVFGLLFLIPSLRTLNEGKYLASFVFFSLSAFIHFRAVLWIIPMVVVWFFHYRDFVREFKQLKAPPKVGVLLAGTMGIIAGGIFLVVTTALLHNTPATNSFAKEFLAGMWNSKHFTVAIGLILMGIYLIQQKSWFLLLGLGNILLMFLKANFLQPWYALYLLPLLFAFRKPTEHFRFFLIRFTGLILMGSSFLNSSPAEFYFLKKVLQLII